MLIYDVYFRTIYIIHSVCYFYVVPILVCTIKLSYMIYYYYIL